MSWTNRKETAIFTLIAINLTYKDIRDDIYKLPKYRPEGSMYTITVFIRVVNTFSVYHCKCSIQGISTESLQLFRGGMIIVGQMMIIRVLMFSLITACTYCRC